MLVFSNSCDASGVIRRILIVLWILGLCQVTLVSSKSVSFESRSTNSGIRNPAEDLLLTAAGNSKILGRSKRSPMMDMLYSSISYRAADSNSRTLIPPNHPDPAKLLEELHDYTNSQAIDPNQLASIDKTHPYYPILQHHLPSSYKDEESSAVHVRAGNYYSDVDQAAALQPDEIKYIDATKYSPYSAYVDPQEDSVSSVPAYPSLEYPSYKEDYIPTSSPKESEIYGPQGTEDLSYNSKTSSTMKPYTLQILQNPHAYENPGDTDPSVVPYPAVSPTGRRGGHGGGGHGGGGHGGGRGGAHGHGVSSSSQDTAKSSPPVVDSKPPPYRFRPHPSVKEALLELRRRMIKKNSEAPANETRDLHPRNSKSPLDSSYYGYATGNYGVPATTPSYGNYEEYPTTYGTSSNYLYTPPTESTYTSPPPTTDYLYGESSPQTEAYYQPPPADYVGYSKDTQSPEYDTTEAPSSLPYDKSTDAPYVPPKTDEYKTTSAAEESPYDKFYYVDHAKVDHGTLAYIPSDSYHPATPDSEPTSVPYETDKKVYVDSSPSGDNYYTSTASTYVQSYDDYSTSAPTDPEDPYAYTSPDETYYYPTSDPGYDSTTTTNPPEADSQYPDTKTTKSYDYPSSYDANEYYDTSTTTTSTPYSESPYQNKPYEAPKNPSYDVETRAEHLHQNTHNIPGHNTEHVPFVGHTESQPQVMTINNVKYKVITDTLTPPQSKDPINPLSFPPEIPSRPVAPQKNGGPSMDPQTARRILELLNKLYGDKATRNNPSRGQPTRYYNYPPSTNTNQQSPSSFGVPRPPAYSPIPVKTDSSQVYTYQGTRPIAPSSTVLRYPYRLTYYPPSQTANTNQQPGTSLDSTSLGYPQYIYNGYPTGQGSGSSYSYNFHTIQSKPLRAKRSVPQESTEHRKGDHNKNSHVSSSKPPSDWNPEEQNSLDDLDEKHADEEDSSEENLDWDDETDKEFQELFNFWMFKNLKDHATPQSPSSGVSLKIHEVPKTSAYKGGRKLTRKFSANPFQLRPTTTTTTTTTPKPNKTYRKDPKSLKKRRKTVSNEGRDQMRNPPSKVPKTIYKIRSPNRKMSMEEIENMLRASGLNLDNAEIEIIDAEEFDEHTSSVNKKPSRPRPISPVTFRPYHPPPQRTTPRPITTTTQPGTTTAKKIYVPHKDTERHEDGSFVYMGSHNLIFPGLYSEETYG